MYVVLAFLRTIICSGVAFVVWWVLSRSLGADSLVSLMVPVWIGGIAGGAVCSMFNARQGITLAFTCGVLLTVGFLYARHGVGGNVVGSEHAVDPLATLVSTCILWWRVWLHFVAAAVEMSRNE